MKTHFVLLLSLLSLIKEITYAEVPGYFEDYFVEDDTLIMGERASATVQYAPYGRYFTPVGDIHILIICAGFGMPYDNQYAAGWPQGENTLPNWITDTSQRYFYSDTSQFETPLSIDSINNLSRYYYEMSGGKLRITADILNTRINIDAAGSGSWYSTNSKVIEKMKTVYPGFDWSKYDKRKNSPKYLFDNSTTEPDHKPDFIVIVYRFNPGWSGNELPVTGMSWWSGRQGGFDSSSLPSSLTYNGYTFDGSGYTHCNSGADFADLFIHETAHGLFNCPHYANANKITGKYFYGCNGWGTMNRGFAPFSCTNGWERWWLDWIGISASGVDSDIKEAADLNATGEYTLRDFVTTGDVLRLKIPNGTGENQYLWLENHRGISLFDKRKYLNDSRGIPFPDSPKGIAGYIESVSDDKNKNPSGLAGNRPNTFKFLHAKGAYDYSFDSAPITTPNIMWGNPYYNFHEHEINPISGQGRNELIRGDYNSNNSIAQSTHHDSSTGSEQYEILKRDGNLTFDALGSEIVFRSGQKLSMASNPCLINRPLYDANTQKMGVHYLNGISVEFLSASKVKIRYNDVDIDRNTRYTGFIRLPNITAGTSTPDIRIMPDITLKIDKSGTPNRHTKTTWNDFINLTEFMCSDSAYFKQEARSTVIVEDSTLLVLESGSKYEINDNARLIIRSGSTLMIKSGATLTVKGSGAIDVENGAFLCIDPAATINLTDSFSVINMKNGSALGKGILNPFSQYATPVYTTNYNSIKDTGKGTVNRFPGSNIYLQNMNITGTKYFFARDILVGRDVIPDSNPPKGSVTIKSGADIRINAEGDVLFKNDVTVEKGASVTVE